MTATEHFQRLHMIERHAANIARESRNCIECMPKTHSNFAMVLDALIAEAEGLNWAEDKLYAPKEEQA